MQNGVGENSENCQPHPLCKVGGTPHVGIRGALLYAFVQKGERARCAVGLRYIQGLTILPPPTPS